MRPEKLAGASWVGWYMPRETDGPSSVGGHMPRGTDGASSVDWYMPRETDGTLVQLDDICLEKLMGPVRLVGSTGCFYFGDYMVISLFSLSFGIWTEICG